MIHHTQKRINGQNIEHQGGPLMNMIDAKHIFMEADTDDFKDYAKNVITNAKKCVRFLKIMVSRYKLMEQIVILL